MRDIHTKGQTIVLHKMSTNDPNRPDIRDGPIPINKVLLTRSPISNWGITEVLIVMNIRQPT